MVDGSENFANTLGAPAGRQRLRDRWEGWPAVVTGLHGLYRGLGPTRRHVVVLNWHHVTGEDFRRQLAYLRERHPIVALAEAVACAAGEASDRRHRVALTFDDALDSFLTGPYPVLREFGVPATLFVPVGLLGQVPFWYTVAGAAAQTTRERIDWRSRTWDLSPGRTRNKTRAAMVAELKALHPQTDRDAALGELLSALGVSRADADAGAPRVMSAEQVRGLDPAVVTIGAHTRSHPRLSALSEPALADEIAGGRSELEALLGRPVRDFAYPYGRPADYSPEAAAAVRSAGLRSAFTTVKGDCAPGADAFALPRVDLAGHERSPALAVRAGGVTRFLKAAFGGR